MLRLGVIACFLLLFCGCTCAQRKPFYKLWSKHLYKVHNWLLADTEAAKYKDREKAARNYLQELRKLKNPYTLSNKLKADGFHWSPELVDFTSYPWVTIAKKRGDCDDYMELWASIFKYRGGEIRRVYTVNDDGEGHVMLLYTSTDTPPVLFCISNMNVLGQGALGHEEALIRLYFKDRTDCFIIY